MFVYIFQHIDNYRDGLCIAQNSRPQDPENCAEISSCQRPTMAYPMGAGETVAFKLWDKSRAHWIEVRKRLHPLPELKSSH